MANPLKRIVAGFVLLILGFGFWPAVQDLHNSTNVTGNASLLYGMIPLFWWVGVVGGFFAVVFWGKIAG